VGQGLLRLHLGRMFFIPLLQEPCNNLNRLNLVNAGVLKINNIPLRSKKYYKDSIGSGIDHLLMKALQKEFTGECTRADIEFSEPLDL